MEKVYDHLINMKLALDVGEHGIVMVDTISNRESREKLTEVCLITFNIYAGRRRGHHASRAAYQGHVPRGRGRFLGENTRDVFLGDGAGSLGKYQGHVPRE